MRIEVITGPMFAGKTSEILRRLERFARAGKFFIYLKPVTDTRIQPTEISTIRGGIKINPVYVDDLWCSPEVLKAEVVVIDEAQFFEGLVCFCQFLKDYGKTVIVGGLDMDAARVPFGEMGGIMAIADQVTKLTAICNCGAEAPYTQKVAGDKSQQIDIGDHKYIACCPKCYLGVG